MKGLQANNQSHRAPMTPQTPGFCHFRLTSPPIVSCPLNDCVGLQPEILISSGIKIP